MAINQSINWNTRTQFASARLGDANLDDDDDDDDRARRTTDDGDEHEDDEPRAEPVGARGEEVHADLPKVRDAHAHRRGPLERGFDLHRVRAGDRVEDHRRVLGVENVRGRG